MICVSVLLKRWTGREDVSPWSGETFRYWRSDGEPLGQALASVGQWVRG